MNLLDHQLGRLLGAASGMADPSPVAPPLGLETRVLAAWRSARVTTMWDTGVLVRGLAVAAFLVLASTWLAVEQHANSDSENLQFADSSVQTDLTP